MQALLHELLQLGLPVPVPVPDVAGPPPPVGLAHAVNLSPVKVRTYSTQLPPPHSEDELLGDEQVS